MAVLEIQANQLGLQAAQDCDRMVKDRTLALQMLNKVEKNILPPFTLQPECLHYGHVTPHACNFILCTFSQEKDRLAALEKRYQSLTGGKTFSKAPNTAKEVRIFSSRSWNYRSILAGKWAFFNFVVSLSCSTDCVQKSCDLNLFSFCSIIIIHEISQYLVHWFWNSFSAVYILMVRLSLAIHQSLS